MTLIVLVITILLLMGGAWFFDKVSPEKVTKMIYDYVRDWMYKLYTVVKYWFIYIIKTPSYKRGQKVIATNGDWVYEGEVADLFFTGFKGGWQYDIFVSNTIKPSQRDLINKSTRIYGSTTPKRLHYLDESYIKKGTYADRRDKLIDQLLEK